MFCGNVLNVRVTSSCFPAKPRINVDLLVFPSIVTAVVVHVPDIDVPATDVMFSSVNLLILETFILERIVLLVPITGTPHTVNHFGLPYYKTPWRV